MENVEIRTITSRNELEEAYDLWAEVFPEDRPFFQERLDSDPSYTFGTTWIAKVDGQLAAAVQLFPYFISLEGTFLKVGGIGSVATLPRFRGKDLASIILRRQIAWMRKHGYDLSFLFTGINAFYERNGWRTLTRSAYSINRNDIPKTEADDFYNVSEFKMSDIDDIRRIYKTFNDGFPGTRIRDSGYWKGQILWRNEKPNEFLVARREGKIVGYMRTRFTSDKDIDIMDCCHLPGEEQAVHSLLKKIYTINKDFNFVRVRVADSHALYRLFTSWRANETTVTGEMWKILDFRRLMGKLRPVFCERLSRAVDIKNHRFSDTSILLQCGDSEVVLSLQEGIVDIEEPTDSLHYNHLLKGGEDQFLSMLLKGGDTSECDVISVLFPKQAYQFWDADSF